jgi:integrase
MSWDGKNRRWLKEYTPPSGQRKKYAVSCRQLGVPESKDASYQAANRWWEAKKAELDAAHRPVPRPPLPMEDVLRAWVPDDFYDDHQKARAYAGYLTPQQERQAVEEVANSFRALGCKVEVRPHPEGEPSEEEKERVRMEAHERAALDFLQQHLLGNEPLPPGLAERLPAGTLPRVQASVTALRGEPAPAERSVGRLCDRWVERQWRRAEAGELTNGWAANTEDCLRHFRNFLGEGADIEQGVTEASVDDFYLFCRRKMQERLTDPKRKAGWGPDYTKKAFDVARRFIRGVWELKWADVTLPRNIDSKNFRFNVAARTIETWTAEEFKTVLAAAQNWRQMPLHLLLMANCGYRHQDVSDLTQEEVDWKHGRIIRVRSKLADLKNAAKVNYKLWPTTFRLLQEHRNTDHSPHARVLLTASGKPWVWEEQVEAAGGKKRLKSSNSINSNFTHLRNRIRFNKPLSLVRKMGASLLNGSTKYRGCVPEYLGEAPSSIKDKHYARPDQALFDQAVTWLGKQVGQA